MSADYYLKNPDLCAYYCSLPKSVQHRLIASGAEICTLGELMQIAEHLKRNLQK